jgi:predicted metal-dependent phosphoesterase TrpH
MSEKTADLHIHSYYSDGTMSPKEILEAAIQNHVGLLAITDHDVLDGSLELKELCRDRDIIYIPGVELDSLEQGVNFHILCYGADMRDENFRAFVGNNRRLLNMVNEKLVEIMQSAGEPVSMEDYNAFRYDRKKGGWKALHYLVEKRLTRSLREGFAYYDKYKCYHDCVDFPSIREVCGHIHKAGGKAVLAHPGVSVKETDMELFRDRLLKLLAYGLDGIECYYATHTEEITKLCLDICWEKKLLVTAGSDCHGDFGSAGIGDINIPISKLWLGDLLR